MSNYRYLFADLLTNKINAELPLNSVTFGKELNTAGPFSGQVMLSGLQSINYNIQDYTTPGRTAIYVDRDGVIVWGGIIWSRSYDSNSQELTFTGKEFESYFERRRINYDYNVAGSSQDQLTVAQNLLNTAQSAANGNIGVQIGTETSGINVNKTWRFYDLKPVAEAIKEMAQSVTGFDWNIDCQYDTSYNITKVMHLDYPKRGKRYVSTDPYAFALEFPGNVLDYQYPEDSTSTVNALYGVGAGNNEAKVIAASSSASLGTATPVTAADQLAAGWPLLEDQVSYTDYNNITALTNLTTGYLNAWFNPVVVWTIRVSTSDPVLGSYKCGDDFRIRLLDPRFPSGLDVVRRLSKYDVTVGDNNNPEYVTLTFVYTP
jgi:hypothetical protein